MRILIGLLLLGYASTQDPNCDYFQNVEAEKFYNIYSPNYPNSYPAGVQCRWIAQCPAKTNCRLDCSEINLPQTAGCTADRVLISETGDAQLAGARQYCGFGSASVTSVNQRISLALIVPRTTRGGRFTCTLYAQNITTTPQPTCRCGWKRSNRIVGGVETGINEYPPMAGVVDRSISQIKCGGVIISEQYVMTAAHCLVGRNVNDIAVVVGEHDVTIGDSPATQGFRATRFIIHPQFNRDTYDYDMAVIVLEQGIVYSDRVGPVCLPFRLRNEAFVGKTVTVLGWGTQFTGGPTSNVLKKADLQVISQTDCRSKVSTLTNRQLCTYTPGKDACQDDSGGPVLYTDPGTGLLFSAGIISFGRLCNNGFPGVNTRVTELLDWLVSVTPNANYCVK